MFGFLAGLDAVVGAVGLMFAMFLVASVLRPLLVAVLGQAPFIGGWLASNVDSGLARFQASIAASANVALPVVAGMLNWTADTGRALLSALLEMANGNFSSVLTLVSVTIPHAVLGAEQYLEGLLAAARADTLQLIQTAEADAASLAKVAEAQAATLFQQAEGDALNAVSVAEGIVLGEVRKVEQTTADLFLQAEADARLLAAQASADAAGLVAAARSDLSGAIGAVEHDLQELAKAEKVVIEDTVTTLGNDIAAQAEASRKALDELDAATKASIEGILNSLPWQALAAGVGASEAWLKSEVRELVVASAKEIKALMADSEALRAKYGPQVKAALDQVRKVA